MPFVQASKYNGTFELTGSSLEGLHHELCDAIFVDMVIVSSLLS